MSLRPRLIATHLLAWFELLCTSKPQKLTLRGRASALALGVAACCTLTPVAASQISPHTRACLERVHRDHGTVARADLDFASVQRHAAAIQRCHAQVRDPTAAARPAQAGLQRTAEAAPSMASVETLARLMARRGGNCAVMAEKLFSYRQLGRGHPWVETTIQAGVRYRCL